MSLLSSDLLEAFVEVATRGSVTAAASALHRSQPAISQRLNQLEAQLGLTLFERRGRKLALTHDGKRLLEMVSGILLEWRDIPQRMATEQAPKGTVTLGTFATISRHIFTDAIADMMREHPDVKCRVKLGLADSLLRELESGAIDVVYLIGDIDIRGLDVVELREVPMRVVLSTELWPHDTPPPLAFLSTLPLAIWSGPTEPSFQMVERHAGSLGLLSSRSHEIPHIETLTALASTGTCYTILPDYVVDQARYGLGVWPLEGFDKTFPLKRYTAKNKHHSMATREVMERIDASIA